MSDTWVVRPVGDGDWPMLRAVRLAMLLDQPSAFGSTFERELGFDDSIWQERARTPAVIALREDGLPLGAATMYTEPGGQLPELTAMWVAGHARGSGVAGALVEACMDVAADQGAPTVRLHVMLDNPRAVACYRRAGFAFDGVEGDVEGCARMSRSVAAPR